MDFKKPTFNEYMARQSNAYKTSNSLNYKANEPVQMMFNAAEQKRYSNYQTAMYSPQMGGLTSTGNMSTNHTPSNVLQSPIGTTNVIPSLPNIVPGTQKPMLDSYDPLPNQRSRFFYENRMTQPPNWMQDGTPTQKHAFYMAANAANLDYLYDESDIFDQKAPFLATFFDRRTLRNEFERFVLAKMWGRSEFNNDGQIQNSLLEPHAKNVGIETRPAKEEELRTRGRSEGDEIMKNEKKSPHCDKLIKKQFFDNFEEDESAKWNENDPTMPSSVNRETFGSSSTNRNRGTFNRGENTPSRRRGSQFIRRGGVQDDKRRNNNDRYDEGGEFKFAEYERGRQSRGGERRGQRPNFDDEQIDSKLQNEYTPNFDFKEGSQRRGRGGFNRGRNGGTPFQRGGQRGGRGGFRQPFPTRSETKKESSDAENYFDQKATNSESGNDDVELENTWGGEKKSKSGGVSFDDDTELCEKKRDGIAESKGDSALKNCDVSFKESDSGEKRIGKKDTGKKEKFESREKTRKGKEAVEVSFGDEDSVGEKSVKDGDSEAFDVSANKRSSDHSEGDNVEFE